MGEEGKMLQNTVVNKKDGMYLFQGTSMATPVAAATCVLAMQRGITGRQKLIDHIQSTCIDLGNKEYYGHGRVSPWNAVQ